MLNYYKKRKEDNRSLSRVPGHNIDSFLKIAYHNLMPDIAQQDITYQPAAKGYSFSTNPVKPSKPERNPKEKINSFALLTFEILGLIAVFVVFLLILNFFNIISLSNIYPNQFGFLPHLNQT